MTFTGLQLRVLRDDGAVVYVNGSEAFRTNMPSGTISAGTRASTAIANSAESIFTSVSLSASLLRSGPNVIAVEVHQSDPTSSDLELRP